MGFFVINRTGIIEFYKLTIMKNKILNLFPVFLFMCWTLLIIYFSAHGYKVLSLFVTPLILFLGFWIWMKQEQMKRRADSAEQVIRKYDTYENELLAVWKIADIKHYDINSDTEDRKEFRKMIDMILSEVEKCNEAKRELDSSIKIFVRRNNVNYSYSDIAKFINEFYELTNFLNLLKKIEPLQEDTKNFPNITRQFDNIDAFLITKNFGTDSNTDCIFYKPRKAIEKNTKDAFNLLVL